MSKKRFFWLHIEKSGGITTRQLLQPYYVEVDRVKRPKCFIQASPQEYNDILNNYRILFLNCKRLHQLLKLENARVMVSHPVGVCHIK